MPIGPSHGARSGGGGSSSGGRRHGGGGGNLLGSILGGVIGGVISSRSHRHHHHDYNDYNNNEPATPSRKKPTKYLVLAIVMLFISIFTFSIRNGFALNAEKNSDYVIKIINKGIERVRDKASKTLKNVIKYMNMEI